MVEEGWGGGDFYAFESRAKVGLLSNQGKKKKKRKSTLSSMGRESCFWGISNSLPTCIFGETFFISLLSV